MANSTEDVAVVFEELGDLEKEFAQVELDACMPQSPDRPISTTANNQLILVRRKEFSLRHLYAKRETLLSRVPDFWPTAFGSGPEEIQQFFSPNDLALISSIKSFSVERYQIESETKGEPRSLRFTFEFAENEFMENKVLVKEFEYKPREDGPGSMVSTPVPIKWKGKKKDVTGGLLDAAVELYQAEQALKLKNGDKVIEIVERESLWQHENLREKMVKVDESDEFEPSFFNWFGFRGAVNAEAPKKPKAENGENGVAADEEDEDEEDVDQMLEVEIFPAGEEVAITLAEDLWADAMDHFSNTFPALPKSHRISAAYKLTSPTAVSAQDEAPFDATGFEIDDEDDEEDDDEEAPVLVPSEEDGRPPKRQRKG